MKEEKDLKQNIDVQQELQNDLPDELQDDFEKESEENTLSLKLENFSGPMDLLLRLVNDAKIEIKDIFLSQVTDQFLLYLDQMNQLDIDKASEYMLIAATLMEIKSHKMLPVMPDFDDPEENPEKVFIRQLEEYKLMVEAAEELKTIENPDRLYKEPSPAADKVRYSIKDMSLENLLNAFAGILSKVELRELDKNTIRAIKKESFSVKDKINYIIDCLMEKSEVFFFDLFTEISTKNEIVVTFSALLELIKLQYIFVVQEKDFGDIKIIRNQDVKEEMIDFEYDEVG